MSPREAAKPLKFYRLLTLSMAYLAGVHYALAFWFGDAVTCVGMTLVLVLCGAYRVVLPQIAEPHRELSGQAFAVACYYVAIAVLPTGLPPAALYICYCLSSLIFCSRKRSTLVMVTLGAAGLLFVPAAEGPFATPDYLSFGLSIVITFQQSFALLGRSIAHQDAIALRIAETECALAAETDALHERQDALRWLHLSLATAHERLERELAHETATTVALTQRRQDERHLMQAMHHDLREPLRSIVSFNQLIARRLAKTEVSPRATQFVDFIEDAGRRMARMLDDLLEHSLHATRAHPKPVSLATVVAEARRNLADLVERQGARVEVADNLPTVLGHATPLLQLFQNLLGNALKFTRPGVVPHLAIDWRADADGNVVVTIQDNGRGIAPHLLDTVFGLFDRGAAGTESEGSGVGLSLCRRIAQSHGARLDVTSILGEGSVFYLRLPAKTILLQKAEAGAVATRRHQYSSPQAPAV